MKPEELLLDMMMEKSVDGFTWYFGANGKGLLLNAQNEDTGLYEDVEFESASEAVDFFKSQGWLADG